MQEFQALTRMGAAAVEAGRLAEAAGLFDEALSCARAQGDPATVDQALCNRAAVAIELGDAEPFLTGLGEILVRSRGKANGFSAAYAIARAHDLRQDHDKAAFYANIALDHACQLGDRDGQAKAHNLLGNLDLATSRFRQAAERFRKALRLAPPATSAVWRALIQENLGYCYVIRGRRRPGLKLLYESLRTIRREGALHFEVGPLLSLCFANLEIGRPESAQRYGERALAGAIGTGNLEARKMALYLLGEAAKQRGLLDKAHHYFVSLQTEFYPDSGYLPELLLAIDVRRLVNLKG